MLIALMRMTNLADCSYARRLARPVVLFFADPSTTVPVPLVPHLRAEAAPARAELTQKSRAESQNLSIQSIEGPDGMNICHLQSRI